MVVVLAIDMLELSRSHGTHALTLTRSVSRPCPKSPEDQLAFSVAAQIPHGRQCAASRSDCHDVISFRLLFAKSSENLDEPPLSWSFLFTLFVRSHRRPPLDTDSSKGLAYNIYDPSFPITFAVSLQLHAAQCRAIPCS